MHRVAWAVSRVLRDFPMLNSTVSGNNVIYRGNVNVGMAVDLNPGLIVPVIHDADHLGLVGIGNRMVDLQPRSHKLVERAVRLIGELGRVPQARARELFKMAGGNAKTAIVMARTGGTRIEAKKRLEKAGGLLRKALL